MLKIHPDVPDASVLGKAWHRGVSHPPFPIRERHRHKTYKLFHLLETPAVNFGQATKIHIWRIPVDGICAAMIVCLSWQEHGKPEGSRVRGLNRIPQWHVYLDV